MVVPSFGHVPIFLDRFSVISIQTQQSSMPNTIGRHYTGVTLNCWSWLQTVCFCQPIVRLILAKNSQRPKPSSNSFPLELCRGDQSKIVAGTPRKPVVHILRLIKLPWSFSAKCSYPQPQRRPHSTHNGSLVSRLINSPTKSIHSRMIYPEMVPSK